MFPLFLQIAGGGKGGGNEMLLCYYICDKKKDDEEKKKFPTTTDNPASGVPLSYTPPRSSPRVKCVLNCYVFSSILFLGDK